MPFRLMYASRLSYSARLDAILAMYIRLLVRCMGFVRNSYASLTLWNFSVTAAIDSSDSVGDSLSGWR